MHSRATMKPAADISKICAACGTEFLAWTIRARACSKRCALRLWRRTIPKKVRTPSKIPVYISSRPGVSTEPKAEYARSQVRDSRKRNREVFLARERRYRAKLPLEVRQRRARDYNLNLKYGKAFGIVEYEVMLVSQLGGCAICGRSAETGKHLHVDHDHATGRIRGLLCHRCNHGMVAVDACSDWADRAAAYKARHSEGD